MVSQLKYQFACDTCHRHSVGGIRKEASHTAAHCAHSFLGLGPAGGYPRPGQLHAFVEQRAEQVPLFLKQVLLLLCLKLLTTAISNQWRTIKVQSLLAADADVFPCHGKLLPHA